jgi:hypothetical protein
MTDYIVNLNQEAAELRKKVDTEFNDLIESKIMTVLEKIKKDNQDQWEQTLKHVNTGFKDAKRRLLFFFYYKLSSSNRHLKTNYKN